MAQTAPDYNHLQSQLMQQDLPITAAEIQGILAGLFVTGVALDSLEWQKELYKYTGNLKSMPQPLLTEIAKVRNQLAQELAAEQGELGLLIPDADEFIVDRAEALIYWCQGFSLCVQGRLGQIQFNDEDCQEAWQDIQEICHLDLDSISENESDEQALVALEEHIKVSVLMLYQHLYRPPETSNTVH